ncbi:hypothetical protein N805_04170 [Pseudomonas putida S13.1.2]|uniref:Uncharacterized protein n=1 Tax=Pseudomonas putida S13.1.2 TaxID=1384061 RepID=A0AAU8S0Q8_PSEPU|nr:hypothetical protein N805_04170 [Pseudomonas putida S13.1.2]
MWLIGKQFGLQEVFGAVIAAGAITIAIAPLFSRLLRFFPHVVIGSLKLGALIAAVPTPVLGALSSAVQAYGMGRELFPRRCLIRRARGSLE